MKQGSIHMTSLQSLLGHRVEAPAEWTGPVPVSDIDAAQFWDGLRSHQLVIRRCADCRFWIHPPLAGCPNCRSMNVGAEPVSGRGTLYAFTVVNREFAPGVKPPYVAAYVDLVEQDSLRLLTNIVNARIGDLTNDMAVQVVYHDIGDETLAYFEPVGQES